MTNNPWLNYYLYLYPNDPNYNKNIENYIKVYDTTSKWIQNQSLYTLNLFIEALQQDMMSEECCVGPVFSVLVAEYMSRLEEDFHYEDWFQEAAIRDDLIVRGIDPCGNDNCYICSNKDNFI